MHSNGKRQQLSPPDVLSNIPKNVMDDILMRLPLRDAVRTSILAKKWRYNWCKLPQLTLDETLWKAEGDVTYLTSNFINIIYHILTLHEGPISKFTLSISLFNDCPNIDNLFSFLSRNGIEHLVLELPYGGNPYKLPSSFFTSLCLRHLTLQRCLIRPPPDFKGFDRLISLELNSSFGSLGSLISNCPLLEHLVLKHYSYKLITVEINAPNLRSFFFEGYINSLHVKNAPLLSKVSYVPTVFVVDTEHDLAKILGSIPALEYLHWNFDVQFMDYGPTEAIPTRLPSALNCLKRLHISRFTAKDFFDVSFALCLIRSSPYLEEIEIEVYANPFWNRELPRSTIDEIPASFSGVTFNHLKTVKINNVAGSRAEMQIIKVLLANSPALVTMVIKPYGMEDKKSLKVLAKITKFQRASSIAEVVYIVD